MRRDTIYGYQDDRYFYSNLKGEVIEKNPINHPYNYDTFLVWKNEYREKEAHAVYSDRLRQWDEDKYTRCCKEAFTKQGQYLSEMPPEEIEKFLALYFDKNIKLTAIEQACNVSNGYPYWIFYYEEV